MSDMREKLIDIVEYYVDFIDRDRKEQLVDAIEELFATENNVGSKWIPVSERLPKPFEDILAYDSTAKRVVHVYMTRRKEWVGFVIRNEVTHWMPLPELPKGE